MGGMTARADRRQSIRCLPFVFAGFALVVPACSSEAVAPAPLQIGQSGSAATGCIDQPGRFQGTLDAWYGQGGEAGLGDDGPPLAAPSPQLTETMALLEGRLPSFSVTESTEVALSPGGCITRRYVALGAADGSLVTVKIWQLTHPMNANTIPQFVPYVMSPPDLMVSSLDQTGEETGIRAVIKVLRDGTSVRVFAKTAHAWDISGFPTTMIHPTFLPGDPNAPQRPKQSIAELSSLATAITDLMVAGR
jgi:hypothetical protein